jgi:membrane-associated phospholipid phosphatase
VKHLRSVDALIIVFISLMSVINFIVADTVVTALLFLLMNLAIAAIIVVLGRASARSENRALRITRNFYPVLMIFVVFKEVHVVNQTMRRADCDPVLIAIDRWIFGTDPTVWLSQFANPVLTEILQVSYASYYILMIVMGVELYRMGPRDAFPRAVFTLTYGFFLSFIGYMLLPAVGPRFTLHDFASLNLELPGLWLTDTLRDWINTGESIPPGVQNPLALVQRDVFPSGHTQITILTIYFAYRYSIRSRYIVYVLGTLLIISTVYLRYHYVIDLPGGALFALLTIMTSPSLSRWWDRICGRLPAPR